MDGDNPAGQTVQLQCLEVGADAGWVGLATEEVEGEEGEEEHGGGGKDCVQHGADLTQQWYRLILGQIERTREQLSDKLHRTELIYFRVFPRNFYRLWQFGLTQFGEKHEEESEDDTTDVPGIDRGCLLFMHLDQDVT